MRKKHLTAAAALMITILLSITASFAADIDYSGPLNSFTGEPETSGVAGGGVQSSLITVSQGVYYDREERLYLYALESTEPGAVKSNVADGMIVNEGVQILLAQNVTAQLYRNGQIVEEADLLQITKPGQYVLEAKGDRGEYTRVLGFTVVGATTGLISSYPMPAGFIVSEVDMAIRDESGEWKDVDAQWTRNSVSMSTEGAYYISYECARNGLTYELQTIIDHTPPRLALTDVVNGLAKGPVDISDVEENCSISIYLNGGKMSYVKELTRSGDYEIFLVDTAGNTTTHRFTIQVYFDTNSLIFFGLVLLVAGGVGVYLYLGRKKLRVR